MLAKRGEWALALYTLLCVIVPLSSLSLQSMTRYVLVMFPVFMLLAVAGKSERRHQVIQTIFISLSILLAALFAAHFSIGET